jgi:signal transduction histidine kinase
MMSVSDEGPEIPNSEKESIFEKYHKVKGNDQPGSGIGLYIVKQIVDLHGGKVNVESKNGHGSTFNVWMPNDACKGNGGKYEKNNDSR